MSLSVLQELEKEIDDRNASIEKKKEMLTNLFSDPASLEMIFSYKDLMETYTRVVDVNMTDLAICVKQGAFAVAKANEQALLKILFWRLNPNETVYDENYTLNSVFNSLEYATSRSNVQAFSVSHKTYQENLSVVNDIYENLLIEHDAIAEKRMLIRKILLVLRSHNHLTMTQEDYHQYVTQQFDTM